MDNWLCTRSRLARICQVLVNEDQEHACGLDVAPLRVAMDRICESCSQTISDPWKRAQLGSGRTVLNRHDLGKVLNVRPFERPTIIARKR